MQFQEILSSELDCTFCKIIRKELPAYILEETEDIICFLSLENHPLVVPKKHVPYLYDISGDLGAALAKQTIRMAKTVKQALACDGVYITQANEPAAGQDVFHVHFHVYPKWASGRQIPRTAQAKQENLEKIKSCL